MSEAVVNELIELNRRLLESIAAGDWDTYAELCDPSLSAFEPEARGYLLEGMDFHRFYFDLGVADGPQNTTISSPKVRLLGDIVVVTYTRLLQRQDTEGRPTTLVFEETRVWHLRDGRWQHVHFHRSANR